MIDNNTYMYKTMASSLAVKEKLDFLKNCSSLNEW